MRPATLRGETPGPAVVAGVVIPRILHQIWLGTQRMPASLTAYRRHFRALHPGWEYRFWTDEDVPDTLRDLFGQAGRRLTNASKANAVRLYTVLRDGGVYADCDIDWRKNIDGWLDAEMFAAQETPGRYCNAMFGAISGHPCLAWQYDQLPEFTKQPPPWGPELMTRGIERYPGRVRTLPAEWIYPYLWHEPRRPTSDFPDAYVVHHWALSWRR